MVSILSGILENWDEHIPCREALSWGQFRAELEGAGARTRVPGGWTVSAAPQRSSGAQPVQRTRT